MNQNNNSYNSNDNNIHTCNYNRSTFSILFYLNTSKKKKSGKCPVMGRISIDGKNTAFSTGLDILPEYWDAKKGLAISKSTKKTDRTNEEAGINRQIENIRSELMNHYKHMVQENGYVTAESLKNALKGIGSKNNRLMQEFAELIEEKRKSIGIKITASTYPVYPNAYKHLKDFISLKYNEIDVLFTQVDIAFIEAYAYYLKIDLKMTPRTVKCNMIPLRTSQTQRIVTARPFLRLCPRKDNS